MRVGRVNYDRAGIPDMAGQKSSGMPVVLGKIADSWLVYLLALLSGIAYAVLTSMFLTGTLGLSYQLAKNISLVITILCALSFSFTVIYASCDDCVYPIFYAVVSVAGKIAYYYNSLPYLKTRQYVGVIMRETVIVILLLVEGILLKNRVYSIYVMEVTAVVVWAVVMRSVANGELYWKIDREVVVYCMTVVLLVLFYVCFQKAFVTVFRIRSPLLLQIETVQNPETEQEVFSELRCKMCGEILGEDALFCPCCGAPVSLGTGMEEDRKMYVQCPACGREIIRGGEYCPYCGIRLSD
ncbi:MAG: zinc ribbon domain-containing protein [Clostridiales bacterium]|nr:zinc ribbon domain-containing protein [Clostridiales bacterium]